MSDTIVITSIYRPFWGTEEFRKSVDKVGLPLHNAFKGTHFTGNGDIIRWIYEALLELKDKYKYAIYSDGADSYFVRSFIPPSGVIVYSTEKAIWPPTQDMKDKWNDFWNKNTYRGDFLVDTPWKYLNGGGYCGEINLLIEFFEKYGLSNLTGDVNGQREQAEAFLKAREDNFPITLDTNCWYFQTTGFAEEQDLMTLVWNGMKEFNEPEGLNVTITNRITGGSPALLHGNGRTDLSWLYNLYK